MGRHINQLPDEIISHILSFLTVRDAIRARLSSSKWLHLPDSRSELHFDCLSVLGNMHECSSTAKFVRIVDQFMQSFWAGNRISRFILNYHVGLEHSSLVNRWVATCIRMKVGEIQLNAGIDLDKGRHVFPSHLLHSGNLKELTLKFCSFSLSFQSRAWLCNLTKLHLSRVLLNEDGWGHILAAGSNLISLTLRLCQFPKNYFIDGQLPSLKNLVIDAVDICYIRLDCPNLEVFKCIGPVRNIISFVHVPVLREATVWFAVQMPHDYKRLFMDIARNAPMLHTLTLWIGYYVRPFRMITAKPSLKELNLLVRAPYGYDVLNVIPFLNACPFIETLRLKQMDWAGCTRYNPRREYPDQPHLRLKHVKIEGFRNQWYEVDLATYLLRNAVALEQMVIEASSEAEEKASTLMERRIHPTAQVIIL